VAQLLISASRRRSAKTEARSARLHEDVDRLADELSDDPDELAKRMSALHSGRWMAATWAPPAIAVVLLVVYKLTAGRGAHDRLSGTHVVATR
jgi:hypothetical protein